MVFRRFWMVFRRCLCLSVFLTVCLSVCINIIEKLFLKIFFSFYKNGALELSTYCQLPRQKTRTNLLQAWGLCQTANGVSLKGFRICNNICTPFLRFGSYRPVCLKKAQNLEVFYLSLFWNLNFEISKVNFL